MTLIRKEPFTKDDFAEQVRESYRASGINPNAPHSKKMVEEISEFLWNQNLQLEKVFSSTHVLVGSGVDEIVLSFDVPGDPCDHNWKTYDSGFRRFDYCSKCNKERP